MAEGLHKPGMNTYIHKCKIHWPKAIGFHAAYRRVFTTVDVWKCYLYQFNAYSTIQGNHTITCLRRENQDQEYIYSGVPLATDDPLSS